MTTGRYAVIFLRSFTRSEAFPPRTYRTMDDAIREAHDYNVSNQDQTWNCVVAYAIDTKTHVRV